MTLFTSALAQDIPVVPGDEIAIEFYDREDLSGEYVIDLSGRVAVPLLGRQEIGGLTAAEIEQTLLREMLQSGLVTEPNVTVQVLRRADIFVDGAVAVPGAYDWFPGLSVGQAVVRAGGQRNAAIDNFNNVLTAYRSAEALSALVQRIANLQAREVRLNAQTTMAAIAFDADFQVDPDAVVAVDLSGIARAMSVGSLDRSIAVFATRDITEKQEIWSELAGQPMLRFPGTVADDPQFTVLRHTHNEQFHDWITTNLAEYSSLLRQSEATTERLSALRARRDIVKDTIVALDARLTDVLALKKDGLVRINQVLDAQTALSQATSTQLEIVDAIANAEVDRHVLQLALENFAGSLRLSIGAQLETVQTELIEGRARLNAVQRAAALSAPYIRGTGTGSTEGAVTYHLTRPIHLGSAPAMVTAATAMMPGDTLLITRVTD